MSRRELWVWDERTRAYRRYHRHMDLIEMVLVRLCWMGIAMMVFAGIIAIIHLL